MNRRLVTLTSGQFADWDLETLATQLEKFGYDGVELACWGKHLNIERAYEEESYVQEVKDIFTRHHLVIASVAVTKENVAQFKGFGGKVNA